MTLNFLAFSQYTKPDHRWLLGYIGRLGRIAGLTLLGLVAWVLLHRLLVDAGLLEPSSQIFNIVGAAAVLAILLKAVAFGETPRGSRIRATFKQFAHDNDFQYADSRRLEAPVQLLETSSRFQVAKWMNAIVNGDINGHNFELSVVTSSAQGVIGAAMPTSFGLLKVSLPHAYAHVIVSSDDDSYRPDWMTGAWVKNKVRLKDRLLDLKYKIYETHDSHGEPIPTIKLREFVMAMKAIEQVEFEIIGNELYFIRKNGLDMTPEGIKRFLRLVETAKLLGGLSVVFHG